MKWSLEIGAPFGIPIRVHWSFLVLLGYVLIADSLAGGRNAGLMNVLLLLAIFVGVVLHELGHALAARRYKIKVQDITLWPLGGIARMEKFPKEPRKQIVIALAGPAVSFLLAGIFGALSYLVIPGFRAATRIDQGILYLAEINLILGMFNLIPALPMDGGRVLRAVLAMTSYRVRATRIAARVGQAFAVAMGIGGLATNNVWLIVISFFIFFSAEREWQVDDIVARFSDIPAWQAMLKPVATAGRMTSVGSLASYATEHEQQDFPVTDGDNIVGLVTRWGLLKAIVEGRREEPVFTIMDRDVETVSPFDTLDRLLRLQIPLDRLVLPVVYQERVVGLVTPERLQQVRLA